MLDQVFRVIVVPSDLIATIDTSDINNVINKLGINIKEIQKIDLNTIK